MNDFAIDRGGRTTRLRRGPVIAGQIQGSESGAGWYRIMPDGVGASRPQANQLQLTNIRADVESVNVAGWRVLIADDDFLEDRRIDVSDSGLLTVYPQFDTPLLTGIRYILVPKLLNPLSVSFEGMGTLEIAYSADFQPPGIAGYSREELAGETGAPTLVVVSELQPGSTTSFPVTDVDNLFYRFTMPSDDNVLTWGEHRVIRRGGGTDVDLSQKRYVADVLTDRGLPGVEIAYMGSNVDEDWDLVTQTRTASHTQGYVDLYASARHTPTLPQRLITNGRRSTLSVDVSRLRTYLNDNPGTTRTITVDAGVIKDFRGGTRSTNGNLLVELVNGTTVLASTQLSNLTDDVTTPIDFTANVSSLTSDDLSLRYTVTNSPVGYFWSFTTATIDTGVDGRALRYTLPTTYESGGAGNEWDVRIVLASGSNLVVELGNQTIVIRIDPSATVGQIRALDSGAFSLVDGAQNSDIIGGLTVAQLAGDQSYSGNNIDFHSGDSGEPQVTVNASDKQVVISYLPTVDTLQSIVEATFNVRDVSGCLHVVVNANDLPLATFMTTDMVQQRANAESDVRSLLAEKRYVADINASTGLPGVQVVYTGPGASLDWDLVTTNRPSGAVSVDVNATTEQITVSYSPTRHTLSDIVAATVPLPNVESSLHIGVEGTDNPISTFATVDFEFRRALTDAGVRALVAYKSVCADLLDENGLPGVRVVYTGKGAGLDWDLVTQDRGTDPMSATVDAVNEVVTIAYAATDTLNDLVNLLANRVNVVACLHVAATGTELLSPTYGRFDFRYPVAVSRDGVEALLAIKPVVADIVDDNGNSVIQFVYTGPDADTDWDFITADRGVNALGVEVDANAQTVTLSYSSTQDTLDDIVETLASQPHVLASLYAGVDGTDRPTATFRTIAFEYEEVLSESIIRGILTEKPYIADILDTDGEPGIQVVHRGDDAGTAWQLITEDGSSNPATLTMPGATNGHSLDLTFPSGLATGADANDWSIVIDEREVGSPAVGRTEAHVDLYMTATSGIRVTIHSSSAFPQHLGASGNNERLRIIRHATLNAVDVNSGHNLIQLYINPTATVQTVLSIGGGTTVSFSTFGNPTLTDVVRDRSNSELAGTQGLVSGHNDYIQFHDGANAVDEVPGEPLAVSVDTTAEEITLSVDGTEDTLTAIAAVINADSDLSGAASTTPDGSTSLLDSRYFGTTVPTTLTQFSGGAGTASDLSVVVDESAQTLTVRYVSGTHTLNQIVSEISAVQDFLACLSFRGSGTGLATNTFRTVSFTAARRLSRSELPPTFSAGSVLPVRHQVDDLFLFTDGVSGLIGAVDIDGITPKTTAERLDLFRFEGTMGWRFVMSLDDIDGPLSRLTHRRFTSDDITISGDGTGEFEIDITDFALFANVNNRARVFLRYSATVQRDGTSANQGTFEAGLIQQGFPVYLDSDSITTVSNTAIPVSGTTEVGGFTDPDNPLLFRVITDSSPSGATWTVSNVAVDVITFFEPSRDRITELSVGGSFPASPFLGASHIFDSDAASITAVDTDGTTAKTSARALDLFRYDGTNWRYVGFIGDTISVDLSFFPDSAVSRVGDNYTLDTVVGDPVTQYRNGMRLGFWATADNVGESGQPFTVRLRSEGTTLLPERQVVNKSGEHLLPRDIRNGQFVLLTYNAARTRFQADIVAEGLSIYRRYQPELPRDQLTDHTVSSASFDVSQLREFLASNDDRATVSFSVNTRIRKQNVAGTANSDGNMLVEVVNGTTVLGRHQETNMQSDAFVDFNFAVDVTALTSNSMTLRFTGSNTPSGHRWDYGTGTVDVIPGVNFGGGNGSLWRVGAAFPSSPSAEDFFLFTTAASSLTGAVDTDGTTAKTSALVLDLFRYNGTNWQYVGFIGDTSGSGGFSVGDTLPTTASTNQLFLFTANATGLTDVRDTDGVMLKATAQRLDLFRHTGTFWQYVGFLGDTILNHFGAGTDFHSDASEDDLFLFTASTTFVSGVVDTDGTTAKTSARAFDLFRYNGSAWQYIGFIGDTAGPTFRAGTTLPTANNNLDDLFLFESDASGLVGAFDTDGTTPKITAKRWDLFRFEGTSGWRFVMSLEEEESLLGLPHSRFTFDDVTISEDGTREFEVDVSDLAAFANIENRGRLFLRYNALVQRTGPAADEGEFDVGLIQQGSPVFLVSENVDTVSNTVIRVSDAVEVGGFPDTPLLFRVVTNDSPSGATWTISNISVDVIAFFEPSGSRVSSLSVASSFPANPFFGMSHIFDNDADSITAVDMDGTTEKTSARALDLFRYTGSTWQYIGFIGDTISVGLSFFADSAVSRVGDNYTLNTAVGDPVTQYRNGMRLGFWATAANDGPVRVALRSEGTTLLPDRPVVKKGGQELSPRDIRNGQFVILTYDSGRTRFQADIIADQLSIYQRYTPEMPQRQNFNHVRSSSSFDVSELRAFLDTNDDRAVASIAVNVRARKENVAGTANTDGDLLVEVVNGTAVLGRHQESDIASDTWMTIRFVVDARSLSSNTITLRFTATNTPTGHRWGYGTGTVDVIPGVKFGSSWRVGSVFPQDPVAHDFFLFTAAVTGLTGAVDTDGTTAKTSALSLDLFRYDGTNWRYVGFIGDTSGSGSSDEHRSGAPVIRVGETFTVDPETDYLFIFDRSVDPLSGAVDEGGVTVKTSAQALDMFRYNGTDWQYVGFIGDTDTLPSYFRVGSSLPASPSSGDLFLFTAAATGLAGVVDTDGTTAKTTASAFDLFQHVGTGWEYVGFIGTKDSAGITHRRFDVENVTVTGDGDDSFDINVSDYIRFLSVNARARVFMRFSATVQRTGAVAAAGNFQTGLVQGGGSFLVSHTESSVSNLAQNVSGEVDVGSLESAALTFRTVTTGSPAGAVWTVSNIVVDVVGFFESESDRVPQDNALIGASLSDAMLSFPRNNDLAPVAVDLTDLVSSGFPLHRSRQAGDVTIGGNIALSTNVVMGDTRLFLNLSDRARVFIRVRSSVTRTSPSGHAAAGVDVQLRDGTTVVGNQLLTAVAADTATSVDFVLNIASMTNDGLNLNFAPSGAPDNDVWNVTDIVVDVVGSMQPILESADLVVDPVLLFEATTGVGSGTVAHTIGDGVTGVDSSDFSWTDFSELRVQYSEGNVVYAYSQFPVDQWDSDTDSATGKRRTVMFTSARYLHFQFESDNEFVVPSASSNIRVYRVWGIY